MAEQPPDEQKNIDTPDLEEQSTTLDDIKIYIASFFTKLKSLLNPLNILRFFIANLWKPVLTFSLLFSLLLGGVYAGGYYKMFNAQNALNFENYLERLRQSEDFFTRKTLPFMEWASAGLGAAGEIMQADIDRRAELLHKQEEEALAKKQEEESKAEEARLLEEAEKKAAEQRQAQAPATPGGAGQGAAASNEQAQIDLKKLAEDRQKELNKRAGRLAMYYTGMKPQEAADIMKNLENDEVIFIMERMDGATAASILALFEPERAAAISHNILRLRPGVENLPADMANAI